MKSQANKSPDPAAVAAVLAFLAAFGGCLVAKRPKFLSYRPSSSAALGHKKKYTKKENTSKSSFGFAVVVVVVIVPIRFRYKN